MRFAPFLLPALLAACAGPATRPSDGDDRSSARPATTPAALSDVAGEWDVVSFDAHRPARLDEDGKRQAYLGIDSGGLRFAIGCNHSSMKGRIDAGVLLAAPDDDAVQTAMGCGAERERRDAAFFRFFRTRPSVALLPDGRLRLRTAAHDLVLERAAVRRLAGGPALSALTGTWRVVGFTRYVGGGHRGWGAMYAPGRVRIDPDRLSYDRCPAATTRVAYTPDFVFRRADGGGPAARLDCGPVRPAPTEVEAMLGALLGQSPEAERVGDRRYILRSRDYTVVLATKADYRREFGAEAEQWERRPG